MPRTLLKIIAVAVILCLAGPSAFNRAALATDCPSGAPISKQQQRLLQQLPLELQTILKAVQKNRKSACSIPTALSPLAIVDPLPINTPSPSRDQEAVADEVVALVTGENTDIAALARANNLTVRSSSRSALLGGTIVRFGINDGRSPSIVTSTLQANRGIDLPAPNHIYQLQGNIYDEARYAPRKIGLDSNASVLAGKGVLIGVIDTAIDPEHPDLKDAIAGQFDALPDQPISNRSHGTAVAGLIAGRSMIKGVAPKARLLVARAFDDGGSFDNKKASATSFQLLTALDWMVTKGARIINMSFSGPRNALMTKALANAARKNILLIAAAGNNGPQAPASYPAAEQSVLAVTATDINDRIYRKANRGRYVFVAAPGVELLVAAPGKGADMVSGTSFAAPFLSGLAALMLEQNKDMTPQQFASAITRSALDLGQPGRDEIFGVGLADLKKALADLNKALLLK